MAAAIFAQARPSCSSWQAPVSRPFWQPSTGIFEDRARQNVAIPPDDPQISTIADYRSGWPW
jgi:hypothetical protein